MNKFYSLFICCTLLHTALQAQTVYYYDGSGALSTTGNWWTGRSATGSNPANFTTASQHFYIQAGQNATNSSAWSISGSNTRLAVEGTATLTATSAITLAAATTFELQAGAAYVHNNTNTTGIRAGVESFAATSTFRIDNWSTGTPVNSGITASAPGFDGNNYYFGNLEINWAAGATWSQNWTSTAIYLTAGNCTFTSSFTGTFRFTGSGPSVSPDVYVAGNFTWNSAGMMDFTSKNSNAYLNVNGNITQTAGTLTVSGPAAAAGALGLIYTYGSGASTWTFSGGTRDLLGYRIALQGGAASKTVNLGADFNMASGANGFILITMLNVAAGCTLDAGPHVMSISAGSTQAAVFGTIRTSNVNGLTGSTSTTFSNSPLVQWGVGTNCTAEYYATGSQTVSAVPIYENVRIMNGGVKTLAGNANVFKTFYFDAAGNYLDAGNNTLTIESTGGISGAGSTSYVITGAGTVAGGGGRLRQNSFSAARQFPVGNSSYYFPVTITPSAAGSFAVNAFDPTGMDGIVQPSAIKLWPEKTYIADVMWNVESITGGVTATVNFNWNADALEGSWFTTRPDNELAVWRRVSDTIWTPAATGFSPCSNTSNYATAVNIAAGDFNTQFVPAWQTQILPLEFLYFTGAPAQNGHQLFWQLNNLINLKCIEVEHRLNGGGFGKIATQPPGNNGFYSFIHASPPPGNHFYRIKLVMNNGFVQYSHIIKVGQEAAPPRLLTPLAGTELVLQQSGAGTVMCRVYDAAGRLVLSRSSAGDLLIRLPLPAMAAGPGVVTLISGGKTHRFRFVKN